MNLGGLCRTSDIWTILENFFFSIKDTFYVYQQQTVDRKMCYYSKRYIYIYVTTCQKDTFIFMFEPPMGYVGKNKLLVGLQKKKKKNKQKVFFLYYDPTRAFLNPLRFSVPLFLVAEPPLGVD